MNSIECAKTLLSNENIIILTHRNPDGDAIGSAAALCCALRRAGRNAYLYPNDEVSDKLLPFYREYPAPDGFEARYTIAVDVASEAQFPNGFTGKVDFCIDHHPSNTRYAAQNFIRPKKAACGEIIADVIKQMNGDITKEEADLLYIAVTTDTGCFQYANTNANTLRTAAMLLEAGADNVRLNTAFFRKASAGRLKLEGMIYDGITLHQNGIVAVAIVTEKMLRESGATGKELDDIASLVGRIEGEKVGITIRELSDGGSKVSVRTAEGINASDICAVFGGGGHALAAGCTVPAPPLKTKELILGVVQEVLK